MGIYYRIPYTIHVSFPLVSAIVLNYRSPKDAVCCIESLRKQTIASDMEILIVDNHSQDDSIGTFRATLSSIPRVRIVENPSNEGFSRGNNMASRYAKGRFLLFVNPDNILPPDAVQRMVRVLDDNEDVGIVGPGLEYPNGMLRPSARAFPSLRDLVRKRLMPRRWHKRYHQEIVEEPQAIRRVDWLVGACLLIRRELFEQLHGFDERFFLFFEDIDLCRRCHALGKQVLFAPDIRVQDRERRLSGHGMLSLLTNRTTRIHVASAMKYFWKWGSRSARS